MPQCQPVVASRAPLIARIFYTLSAGSGEPAYRDAPVGVVGRVPSRGEQDVFEQECLYFSCKKSSLSSFASVPFFGRFPSGSNKAGNSRITMDDDAFRFGTVTKRVKGWLRASRFLSASMVVYLRLNCRFE